MVRINRSALLSWGGPDGTHSRLRLNLFPDTAVEFRVTHRQSRGSREGELWRARGVEGSQDKCVLTLRGSHLTGNVSRTNGDFYRIRSLGGGLHLIRQVSYSRIGPFDDAVERPPRGSGQASKLETPTTKEMAGPAMVDILIAYTPSARVEAGGVTAIENLAQMTIDEMNQGFDNSGIDMQVRLVHSAEFTPTQSEAANGSFLGYVTDQTWLSEVAALHALRDAHGADVVGVWIDGPGSNGGVVGIAWVMGNPGPGFEDSAFSVSEVNFVDGPAFTFAHEVGHNLGCGHERGNGGGGAYSYSWGYKQPNGANDFHTIMSYQCSDDWCTPLNNWSNPNVNYVGQPTGVPSSQSNSADNRMTLNNTGPIAAAWRAEVVNQPPTITPIPNQNNAEGDAVSVQVSANDPEGATLTYSAGGLPAGVSIGSSSGLISGTIAAGSAASYNVTVSVSDGANPAVQDSFSWNVSAPPPPPPPQPNVAVGAAATQSSTINGAAASRAVDGDTDGNYHAGSVTHTNWQWATWWEVDLGQLYDISDVVVWNRTDCCGQRLSNFHVFVSNDPFASQDLTATQNQAGVSDFPFPGAPGASETFAVNRTGRYVRVQLTGGNFLSLAEVQVLGAPATATSNLALGAAATQSSTINGASALRAADGNTSGDYWAGSVTHTNWQWQAWWEVDLGQLYDISDVVVWNRTDCCGQRLSNFHVFVSNTPFASQDLTATQNQAGVADFHFPGAPGASETFAVNRAGRYLRVQLTGGNFLSLGEVQVFGTAATATSNVALGAAATQSSTINGASASRAADGNTNGDYHAGSVTHTNWQWQTWWEVDLGQIYNLSDVVVWNRTDCCGQRLSNFHVFVSNTPFASQDLTATQNQSGVSDFSFPGTPGASETFAVNRTGRYVRVQLTGGNFLSLGEVQVFGSP